MFTIKDVTGRILSCFVIYETNKLVIFLPAKSKSNCYCMDPKFASGEKVFIKSAIFYISGTAITLCQHGISDCPCRKSPFLPPDTRHAAEMQVPWGRLELLILGM